MEVRGRIWFLVLWACLLVMHPTANASSYFVFDLDDTEEDCYTEDVVSRSVNSDVFLHFEILEPAVTDAVDVQLTSPSGRGIQAWSGSKGNHTSILVRESGLYSVCFTKTASSSRRLSILYAFDHASIGSRTLTRYPASVSTILREKPDETTYTELNLETAANGDVQSMGLVQFVFSGVSKSIIHDNTRIMMSFSVEYASVADLGLSVALVAGGLKHPSTWNAMSEHVLAFSGKVTQTMGAKTGGTVFFDITDDVTAAMNAEDYPSIVYSIQVADEGGSARLTGNAHSIMAHYPVITFEDMGLDVMREIGHFRYSVWDLKGELISIIQNERHSRNTAETVQSRVVWGTVLTNIVLLSLAIGQVLYVRNLIGTGYAF
ncbi:hypothetical protein, variant 1 [Aphanomyces invadans]|uniref:GOLD domain-containing protein n=1 Tax=Aphanomyces invadans TaxID=157072 RepID=A0A024TBI5_9STRA|nr:hypothetical protein, variant 1 [Aphanomyces invadans]ETV91515.1 hypothetical protein, variant 1 [Aphanomyces invadans]|eukprot:XP_008879782.1 hypothetical protein, variant 1 [Aphanomyces invadans]